MSTLSVVEKILREAAVPMSVKEIVAAGGAELPTKSKTPDTVVARDLSMDIKKNGENSLFVRTAPGRYGMRAQQLAATHALETQNQPESIGVTDSVLSEGRAPTKSVGHPERESVLNPSSQAEAADPSSSSDVASA